MAALVRPLASAASGTSTSFTCAKPAGTVAGDILIALHACDAGAMSLMGTPSGGSTWQPLLARQWDVGEDPGTKLWWKTAGASEPSTYGFTQGSGSDGIAIIAAISGVSQVIVSAQSGYYTPGVFATALPTPGIFPNGADDIELRFVTSPAGGVETLTSPAGMSTGAVSVQSQKYTCGSAAYRQLTSSSPTGTLNFSASPGLSLAQGFTVAIQSVATQVAKSGSDSAALTEQASVSVAQLRSDSAALTDNAQASPLVVEQANLAETIVLGSAAATADTATAAETALTAAEVLRPDTATLGEANQLSAMTGRNDTSSMVEAAAIGLSISDQVTLAEIASKAEFLGPVTADQVAVNDAASAGALLGTGDTAAVAEHARVDVPRAATDSAALNEQAAAGPGVREAVALAESANVTVLLDRSDVALLADAGSSAKPTNASDSAALIETALVAEVGRAITGVEDPRRQWGASSGRRQWSVDTSRRTWSASTHT
ncbi:hypothetical protein AB0L53_31765 [Nonomuraea sp. NPDC052129]|uniref:hypothetical protein n=1 Tax=Nonomuraea sp. NPDC052129 TaxID=3154651 RepID=UPI003445BFFA